MEESPSKKAVLGSPNGDTDDDEGTGDFFSKARGQDYSTISLRFVDPQGRVVPKISHDMASSGLVLRQLSKSSLSRKQRSWIDPLEPAIQNSFYQKSLKKDRPDFETVEKVHKVPDSQLTGLFQPLTQVPPDSPNPQVSTTSNDADAPDAPEAVAEALPPCDNAAESVGNVLNAKNAFDTLKSTSYVMQKEAEVPQESEEHLEHLEHLERSDSHTMKTAREEELELMSADGSAHKGDTGGKFGAWDGVFTGCILNIFGVIMFLRVGWIVGQAGISGAIVIILISSTVTFLTTLSMSAICTNGTILSGGAYYIISRSLGPAIGGSVGLMFSLGNMVAVSLYLIGFAETLVENIGTPVLTGDFVNDVRVWSNIVLCFELVLALIGLKYVVKANMGLLVLILVTIVCFFVGSLYRTSNNDNGERVIYGIKGWGNGNLSENMGSSYVDGYEFWSVLSIFFPAVTGIMAGANISGDLKNPSSDIPLGTLSAVILSTFTYCVMALFVGAVTARSELLDNFLVMADVAVWDGVVLIGVYAATLSSGIAALVGAPRILQAVAQDGVLDLEIIKFFAVTDEEGNPIRGYFLSFLVAAGCNCIGELNFVAPLISEFFMIAYLLLNFSCFAMEISKTPNWRPNFRYFSVWGALLGFLLCLVVMFLIDWVYALITVIIGTGIFGYIYVKDPPVDWGSAVASRNYYQISKALQRLRKHRLHVKNWRPNVLVLVKNLYSTNSDKTEKSDKLDTSDKVAGKGSDNLNLILFAQTLKKAYAPLFFGTAIVVKDRVATSENVEHERRHSVSTITGNITNITNTSDVCEDGISEAIRYSQNDGYLPAYLSECKGFYNTILCENIRMGACNLVRSSGIGTMRPNTVMMGFLNKWEQKTKQEVEDYVQIVRDALSSRMGVIVACQGFEKMNFESDAVSGGSIGPKLGAKLPASELDPKQVIDVWWLLDDGGLTILVPHIMKQDEFWKGYKLRMNLIVDKSDILHSGVTDVKTIESLIHTQFRLSFEKEARVIYVEQSEPRDETVERYNKLLTAEGITVDDLPRPKVVKRWLRLSELLYENSKDSGMVVVSLPLPSMRFDAKAYVALLSVIGDQARMPPMLIMRGNGQSSLTFYSD